MSKKLSFGRSPENRDDEEEKRRAAVPEEDDDGCGDGDDGAIFARAAKSPYAAEFSRTGEGGAAILWRRCPTAKEPFGRFLR